VVKENFSDKDLVSAPGERCITARLSMQDVGPERFKFAIAQPSID
jgi:hypothetical protein